MLFEKLKQDMMSARKNKESEKAVWLSALIGELQRGGGKEFEDTQILSLIKKHVGTLHENLKSSPGHLATQNEIAFLTSYLPQQMSEAEIRAAVDGLITEGAGNMKELMTGLQSRYAGLYDGRLASGIVKAALDAKNRFQELAHMDGLLIREIVPGDFEQWAPLWAGYNLFYERSLPAELTQATWSRFLAADEPMYALVAEQQGQLLGLVHYLFHRSTSLLAPTCYLQDLFTDPSLRGQGVGRALIEAVYQRAAAAGSSRVYWQTHETNHTAMKLYDKVAEHSGFVVYRKQIGT